MQRMKKIILADLNISILTTITLIVLLICAAAFGKSMYSLKNIQSMAFQIPEFGFLALAMMMSNLIGGIDLSIIATANTVAVFTAFILNGSWSFGLNGWPLVLAAIVIGILISLMFGLFNGLLIARTSAPPIIATLGTMTLFQGIGMALTGGSSVGNILAEFAEIGKLKIFEIPFIFWLFLLVSCILGFILTYTSFGRRLYLYGGNSVAARFSAINNEWMCISVFLITGLLSGLSGLIILSRVNSAKVGYGDSYLLQTMIVCVIGGIHPNGGIGKVQGVVIAVVLMRVMSSAFTIMSLSPYTKKLIWGFMLLLVLGLNFILSKYNETRKLRSEKKEN